MNRGTQLEGAGKAFATGTAGRNDCRFTDITWGEESNNEMLSGQNFSLESLDGRKQTDVMRPWCKLPPQNAQDLRDWLCWKLTVCGMRYTRVVVEGN